MQLKCEEPGLIAEGRLFGVILGIGAALGAIAAVLCHILGPTCMECADSAAAACGAQGVKQVSCGSAFGNPCNEHCDFECRD